MNREKQTIYNVASAVVKYQQDFFDKGEKYLKTLTLKQIAEEVGVHESTVSRSINGKYMQSPRGVFELKYFFSSGVSGGDGAGVSSNSVKSIIKEIINGEDPRKPYSDQDMVEILKRKGNRYFQKDCGEVQRRHEHLIFLKEKKILMIPAAICSWNKI